MYQWLLSNPVTVGLCILLLVIFVFRRRKNLPPGPPGLPLIGNLLSIKQQTILEDLEKLRGKYGDIYTIQLGQQTNVIVNGYDNIKDLFLKRGDEFSSRPSSFLVDDLSKRSELQLARTILDLFAAGTETTATTLRWAVLFLLHNPEVQNEVHKEIDTVIGASRSVSLADRPILPYCEAFITEVLRCGSIAAISLPHSNDTETKINGYTIPEGTSFLPVLHSVMMDPNLFPNPEEFNPSRFIDANGCFSGYEKVIAFSIGRRNCLGESLARSELFLFLTAMLQRFTFLPEDKNNLPTLQPVMGLSRAPVKYKFCAVKRI